MQKGKTMILLSIIAGYAIRFLSLFGRSKRHQAIASGANYSQTIATPAPKPHAFIVDAQKQREMNVAQNRPPIKLNQWNMCPSV